jgi:hypothetical protein
MPAFALVKAIQRGSVKGLELVPVSSNRRNTHQQRPLNATPFRLLLGSSPSALTMISPPNRILRVRKGPLSYFDCAEVRERFSVNFKRSKLLSVH